MLTALSFSLTHCTVIWQSTAGQHQKQLQSDKDIPRSLSLNISAASTKEVKGESIFIWYAIAAVFLLVALSAQYWNITVRGAQQLVLVTARVSWQAEMPRSGVKRQIGVLLPMLSKPEVLTYIPHSPASCRRLSSFWPSHKDIKGFWTYFVTKHWWKWKKFIGSKKTMFKKKSL